MQKHLFLCIVDSLSCFGYFQLRYDDFSRHILWLLTKCTTAMQMVAYGIAIDCVGYLKIGERTTMKCMKIFAVGIIQVFGQVYQANVDRLCKCWKHVIFLIC